MRRSAVQWLVVIWLWLSVSILLTGQYARKAPEWKRLRFPKVSEIWAALVSNQFRYPVHTCRESGTLHAGPYQLFFAGDYRVRYEFLPPIPPEQTVRIDVVSRRAKVYWAAKEIDAATMNPENGTVEVEVAIEGDPDMEFRAFAQGKGKVCLATITVERLYFSPKLILGSTIRAAKGIANGLIGK